MHIVIGLVITIAAALIVIKTDWLINNFGHMGWAESKIGMFGGTRLIIKLIGLIFIFVGFLYMTGLHESFLGWIASWLIPGNRIQKF